MPIYYKNNQPLLFIHIPKCAGTYIEEILRSVADIELLHNTQSLGLPCNGQHFHADLLLGLIRNIEAIPKFTVVRHPLLRILSEYTFSKERAIAKGNHNYPDADLAINNYINAFYKNNNFADNHIRPQVEFLLDDTKIFRLEEGLVGIEDFISSSLLVTDLIDSTVKTKKNVSAKDDSIKLSYKTIKRIEEFYKHDYQLFGYNTIKGALTQTDFLNYTEIKDHVKDSGLEAISNQKEDILKDYTECKRDQAKYVDIKFSFSELIELYPVLKKKPVLKKRIEIGLNKVASIRLSKKIHEMFNNNE